MLVRTSLSASAIALGMVAASSWGSSVAQVTHYNGGDQIWIKAESFDLRSQTLVPGTPDFQQDTNAGVLSNTLSGKAFYFPGTAVNGNADEWWAEYSINPADVSGVTLSGQWGFYARAWQPAANPTSSPNHFNESDYLFVKGDPGDGSGANWYTNAMATRSQPGDLVQAGGDRILNDMFYRIASGSNFQWISCSAYGNYPGEPAKQYDVLINKTFNPAEEAGKITFRINKREYSDWNARLDYIVFSNTPAFNSDFGEWGQTGGGSWNTVMNWTHGQQPLNMANLLGGITADSVINVDTPASVGGFRFDNAHKYTIGGSLISLWTGKTSVNSTVDVVNGDHEISTLLQVQSNATFTIASGKSLTISGGLTNSGPQQGVQTTDGQYLFAGKSITKAGAGTLTIGGAQSWDVGSTLAANGGTTNVNGDVGSATVFNAAITTANSGTALNFGSTQHLLSLGVGAGSTVTVGTGGDKVLVAKSLTVAGSLNLKNNDMIVGDDTTPAVMADVRALIKSGKILTDVALAAPKTGMLGYAQGSDELLAQSLKDTKKLAGEDFQNGSVIVKYTYQGDADLDGDADGNDIGTWALNFTGELGNPASPSKFWTNGDWDYDGDVDGNDAGSWALNFTGELGGGGLSINAPGASPEAVAMLEGMGFTVVPEPATLGLLAVGAMGLLARRRRQ